MPMVAAAGSLCPMAAAALQKKASDTRSPLVASLDERFEFADVDAWMENLNSKGYVVIKAVANTTEVETIKALLWKDLELMHLGLRRSEPDSWHLLKDPPFGLCGDLAQSQGQWYLRGIPKVKGVFERIWRSNDLLVSMDCVLLRKRGMPDGNRTEGLHIDQNPLVKKHRESVQGMMPLLDVTPATGGLEVVPESHAQLFQDRLAATHPNLIGKPLHDDWCALGGFTRGAKAAFYTELERDATLLQAEPGDLILWDSRTVHGGRVPEERALMEEGAVHRVGHELGRMSCTVAMTPRAFAVPRVIHGLRNGEVVSTRVPDELSGEDQALLISRRMGFEQGLTFNHCPHQGWSSGTVSPTGNFKYCRPRLTAIQERLIDGTTGCA